MAAIQSPVIVSAAVAGVAAIAQHTTLRKPKNQFLEASPKAPFSAVVPSRIVYLSKPFTRITLETIDEEDAMDSPRNSSASSMSSSSSSSSSLVFLRIPEADPSMSQFGMFLGGAEREAIIMIHG